MISIQVQAAHILDIPVIATEQYPKGLFSYKFLLMLYARKTKILRALVLRAINAIHPSRPCYNYYI